MVLCQFADGWVVFIYFEALFFCRETCLKQILHLALTNVQILHPSIYLVLLLNECSHFQAAVGMSCKAVNCLNCYLVSSFSFL